MGYTYEQRKRPRGPQNTATERTADPGPVSGAMIPGTAITQNSPSFDLDAAMQARMASTFGDLSALKNYTPPAQTGKRSCVKRRQRNHAIQHNPARKKELQEAREQSDVYMRGMYENYLRKKNKKWYQFWK